MLRAVAFWTAGCGCGRVDLARLFADLDLRGEEWGPSCPGEKVRASGTMSLRRTRYLEVLRLLYHEEAPLLAAVARLRLVTACHPCLSGYGATVS